MPESHPIADRDSLFAVWRWSRWSRWTWSIVAVLMPVTYLLSAAPTLFFLERSVYYNETTQAYWSAIYWPVIWGVENNAGFSAAIQWQFDVMSSAFRDPTD